MIQAKIRVQLFGVLPLTTSLSSGRSYKIFIRIFLPCSAVMCMNEPPVAILRCFVVFFSVEAHKEMLENNGV
jgi:hypothetical protein